MRDIKNYENQYAVTSCGKVWSYKSNKFLQARASANGYMTVCLYKDGKGKNFYIHRLVAETYIDNPDNKPQVNHKDENKTHNYINNLEWVSVKENSNHGSRIERIAKAHRKAIYCVELDRVFESQAQACRELDINPAQLSGVLKEVRRYKTAGGYHWEYINE